MAIETTLKCDKCQKRHAGRVIVKSIEARHHGDDRWIVELCNECVREMHKTYGWRPQQRSLRKNFQPHDEYPDGDQS